MRIDQRTSPKIATEATPAVPPETTGPRAKWPSMAVLALLMAGTSGAVASWVSPWLVPPYLALMAWLLIPSTGRPAGDPASEGSEESDAPRASDDSDPSSDDRDSPEGAPEDGSEPGTSPKGHRARRGKGRAKKAKATPEPAEATWVQVAPGKFVRVESSDESTGQAGPHSPVGVPAEPSTSPQPPGLEGNQSPDRAEGWAVDEEPPGDSPAAPSFGRIEGPDPLEGPSEDAGPGDPGGGVESGSSIAEDGDTGAESPGTCEETSAVDGNAPRAEKTSESPDATTPDVPPEAADDRPEPEVAEGWQGAGDVSPSSEPPEPPGARALADVPPEDADEGGETPEGTDPTETAVDETVLDDAGPSAAEPLEIEPPGDADLSEPGTLSDVPPDGPNRWPVRLAPRAWTRVGTSPRAADREAAPRRPVRSHGPSRRPRDPRRLGRRGVARPRQVNRTFPPRSPPSGRAGRGRLVECSRS